MTRINWENYARQYDRVVCRSNLYLDLLKRLLGEDGRLARPAAGCRALDLGGGTGTLAKRLVSSDDSFHVTVIDNDPAMLELCRRKCTSYLSRGRTSSGIRIIESDLTQLKGLPDISEESWDLAFLVNVLYSLTDPEELLPSVCALLRPGGELRLSEPRRDTDVAVLMEKLKQQLTHDPEATDLWDDFDAVQRFNTGALDPYLHRWTTGEMIDLLRSSGFGLIVYASEDIYAGQSLVICARK